MKNKVLLGFFISLINGFSCSSFSVFDVNKNDENELSQICALFEDTKNSRESFTDPEDISKMIHGDTYKTVVCKTNTVPPVVVGVLSYVYRHKGMVEHGKNIAWKTLGSGYVKTNADAICYSIIAVHPEYRRQGVATELMQHTDKSCIALGMKNIILWVYKDNKRAIECYEKEGFSILEEGSLTKKMHKSLDYVDSPLYFLNKIKKA